MGEEAFGEVNDLEAARLAIRGALSTIRNLQDINAQVKGQLQEEANRRKAAEARIADLAAQVERWEQSAREWERERKTREGSESLWRSSVRAEVRAEERALIEENRRRLEDELARVRADLELIVAANREKKEQWAELQRALSERDAELLAVQREKVAMAERFRHDAQLLETIREERDKEIAAALRGRDLELEAKEREILALRASSEEFQRQAQEIVKELELRRKEQEEKLQRQYRLKEQELLERYNKRETELQASWSELEGGLWKRTKEARDKLDLAVQAQFEEKSRALADRSKEIEELLARSKKELEDGYLKKCGEAEARYAELERRLADEWTQKERRSLEKFETELAKEKRELQGQLDKRARELETEHDVKLVELGRKADELESEYKHRTARLIEDAARKDAERIRQHDDFIAKKSAELEAERRQELSALREKELALEEERLKREATTQDELNRRKLELLAENEKALRTEKAALGAEHEAQGRALEQAYQAKVAEVDRLRQTLEEQFTEWKKAAATDYAQKEKSLDARWYQREQELLRAHETRLEEQRRSSLIEAQKTREHFERAKSRLEEEHLARGQGLKSDYERLERELKEKWAKDWSAREEERRALHEKDLAEARDIFNRKLQLQAQNAEGEMSRLRTELEGQIQRLMEKDGTELAERERLLARKEAALADLQRKREEEAKDLKERLDQAKAEQHAQWEGFQARERELQGQFSKETADLEERHRRALDDFKKQALAELENQKNEWMERQMKSLAHEKGLQEKAAAAHIERLDKEARLREAELGDRRRALEAFYQKRAEEQNMELARKEAEFQGRHEQELARLRAELTESLREKLKAQVELEKTAQIEAARRDLEAEFQAKSRASDERAAELEREWGEKQARLNKAYLDRLETLNRDWKRREEELLKEVEEHAEEYRVKLQAEQGRVRSEGERRLRDREKSLQEKYIALIKELKSFGEEE